MMYAKAVLEIWIDVGMFILVIFFAIQDLRKALRQNSRKTELGMMAAIQAEKMGTGTGGGRLRKREERGKAPKNPS